MNLNLSTYSSCIHVSFFLPSRYSTGCAFAPFKIMKIAFNAFQLECSRLFLCETYSTANRLRLLVWQPVFNYYRYSGCTFFELDICPRTSKCFAPSLNGLLLQVETNFTLNRLSPESFICKLPDSGRRVTRPIQGLSSLAPEGGKRRDPGNEVELKRIQP